MYTQPEWAAAFALDPDGTERRLLPIRIDDCVADGLLKSIVSVDIHGMDAGEARDALLRAARDDRLKPSAPPAYPGRGASFEPAYPGETLIEGLQRRLSDGSSPAKRTDSEQDDDHRHVRRVNVEQSEPAPSSLVDRAMGEEFLEGELKDLVLATDRLSILIIDVDGQGGINTRFGFEVGDLVLQAVAQIVASDPQCSRVGRCGDDTFFALVHSGVEVADQVAQRIVDEVREYYWPQITPGLWVRCSIGVAEFGDSTDAVIRAAIGCREVRRKHGGNGVARGPLLMPDGKFREETRSMRLKDIHS